MASVLKRPSNSSVSDRDGLCRAMTRKGEPCRRKALGADGLCLVHNGSQDMKELGRLGGRAISKARRKDPERQTLREFLRREVDPARVWAAIEAGLESGNDRDRLAASKLLLTELYEPAAEQRRVQETEVVEAREAFSNRVEGLAGRAVLRTLVERGVIRPGGAAGRSFEGVVMFDLRELAEWAATWSPRPLTVTDVPCATCGKAGVRLVVVEGVAVEGEVVGGGTVDGLPVFCRTCRPKEASRSQLVAEPEATPADAVPLQRRSLT
jgi:hypothetical protein